jgi:hypothetical protein
MNTGGVGNDPVLLKDDREVGGYDALSFIDEQTARRAVPEAEEFVAAVSDYIAKLNPRTPQL